MALVAPSILSADITNLQGELTRLGPVEILHIDIMDGHFVPNLTFGPHLVKSLRKLTSARLDAHLMIENPKTYAPLFYEAGADNVTLHVETTPLPMFKKIAQLAHMKGKTIGITLRPKTPLKKIFPYLPFADLALIMSVEPGFAGQQYIPASTKKIAELRAYIDKLKKRVLLQVDGGINDQTAPLALSAGANVLVSGHYIFSSRDYRKAMTTLTQG